MIFAWNKEWRPEEYRASGLHLFSIKNIWHSTSVCRVKLAVQKCLCITNQDPRLSPLHIYALLYWLSIRRLCPSAKYLIQSDYRQQQHQQQHQ